MYKMFENVLKVCLVSFLIINNLWAQQVSQDDIEGQRVEPFQVFDNLYYVGSRSVSAWLLVSDQGLILFLIHYTAT